MMEELIAGIPQGEAHSGFVAADIKQLLEQTKVGVNAEEAFTESEEQRDEEGSLG